MERWGGRDGGSCQAPHAGHAGAGRQVPAWVDDSLDLTATAPRLAWGKVTNNGQTCVAPDYVLMTRDLVGPLVDALREAVVNMYGTDPHRSPDYGRIVNERHAERIAAMLQSANVAIGGDFDVADRYVAPTVLVDVQLDDKVMADEIFDPVHATVVVDNLDAGIDIVNDRDKPLALYAFANRSEVRKTWLKRTSSGGLCFGIPMVQLGVEELPFGGVGGSGMAPTTASTASRRSATSSPESTDRIASRRPTFAASSPVASTSSRSPTPSTRGNSIPTPGRCWRSSGERADRAPSPARQSARPLTARGNSPAWYRRPRRRSTRRAARSSRESSRRRRRAA